MLMLDLWLQAEIPGVTHLGAYHCPPDGHFLEAKVAIFVKWLGMSFLEVVTRWGQLLLFWEPMKSRRAAPITTQQKLTIGLARNLDNVDWKYKSEEYLFYVILSGNNVVTEMHFPYVCFIIIIICACIIRLMTNRKAPLNLHSREEGLLRVSLWSLSQDRRTIQHSHWILENCWSHVCFMES